MNSSFFPEPLLVGKKLEKSAMYKKRLSHDSVDLPQIAMTPVLSQDFDGQFVLPDKRKDLVGPFTPSQFNRKKKKLEGQEIIMRTN